jgi:hypothetical protein
VINPSGSIAAPDKSLAGVRRTCLCRRSAGSCHASASLIHWVAAIGTLADVVPLVGEPRDR